VVDGVRRRGSILVATAIRGSIVIIIIRGVAAAAPRWKRK